MWTSINRYSRSFYAQFSLQGTVIFMHSSPPSGFVLPGRQERAPEGFMTPKSEVSEAPSQASHALDVKIHYRPGQHVVTSWHPQIHPQRSPTDIFMLVIGFWKILEAFFWLIHWRISWNGHHFGHPYPVAKVQKVWPVSLFTFEVWPATHGIQAMTDVSWTLEATVLVLRLHVTDSLKGSASPCF